MPSVLFLGPMNRLHWKSKIFEKGKEYPVSDEYRDKLLNKTIRGKRLFEDVSSNEEDAGAGTIKQITPADKSKGWAVGKFTKKAVAEEYAAVVHNVELDKRLSMKELNAQTATLHNRAAAGASPEELIANLRNASVKEDEEVKTSAPKDTKDDPKKDTPKKKAPAKAAKKGKGVTIQSNKASENDSEVKADTKDDATDEESVVV